MLLLRVLFFINLFFAFNAHSEEHNNPAILKELNEVWQLALSEIQDGKHSIASMDLDKVDRLRIKAGYDGLEEYSLLLIQEAAKRVKRDEIDEPAYLVKRALQLSPMNPEVILRSIAIVDKTGVMSTKDLIISFFESIVRSPKFILSCIVSCFNPFLWAVTIGLYIVCCLFCIYHFKSLCAGICDYIPKKYWHSHAPLFVCLLLIVPVLFGPIWCLVFWSFLVHLCHKEKHSITHITGLCLIGWGVLSPVNNGLTNWINDEGIKSVLRVVEGSFSSFDIGRFKSITDRKGDNPIVWYAYAQYLKKTGQFIQAKDAFKKVEELLPDMPQTKVQKANIEYLLGNLQEAEVIYEQLIEDGLKTPEIYYNYSKILFDLIKTEKSKSYLTKAFEMDRDLVNTLKMHEDDAGGMGLGELKFPLKNILLWSISDISFFNEKSTNQLNQIALGMTPIRIIILGLLMFFMPFFVRPAQSLRFIESIFQDYDHPKMLSDLYKAIPGGGWITNGDTNEAFVVVSVVVIFALSFVGWPVEFTSGFMTMPYFQLGSTFLFSLSWLLACYFGYPNEVSNEVTWKQV